MKGASAVDVQDPSDSSLTRLRSDKAYNEKWAGLDTAESPAELLSEILRIESLQGTLSASHANQLLHILTYGLLA